MIILSCCKNAKLDIIPNEAKLFLRVLKTNSICPKSVMTSRQAKLFPLKKTEAEQKRHRSVNPLPGPGAHPLTSARCPPTRPSRSAADTSDAAEKFPPPSKFFVGKKILRQSFAAWARVGQMCGCEWVPVGKCVCVCVSACVG